MIPLCDADLTEQPPNCTLHPTAVVRFGGDFMPTLAHRRRAWASAVLVIE